MDAEINNVIYMELNSGPKIANSTCGKTIIAGTIDRDSTVMCIEFVNCELTTQLLQEICRMGINIPASHVDLWLDHRALT